MNNLENIMTNLYIVIGILVIAFALTVIAIKNK